MCQSLLDLPAGLQGNELKYPVLPKMGIFHVFPISVLSLGATCLGNLLPYQLMSEEIYAVSVTAPTAHWEVLLWPEEWVGGDAWRVRSCQT